MSELTKERLEEYARDGRNAGDVEVEQMARELLTLRALRDAGDEVVEKLEQRRSELIGQWLDGDNLDKEGFKNLFFDASECCGDAIQHAITRGQQLREAQEEIERLKESVDSRVPSLVARIATLTAERDEARKHLRKANDQTEEYERKYYLELNKTEDLTSELAALKSAPGMEEIADILTPWAGQPFKSIIDNFKEMRTVARPTISSRQEVVGYIKTWFTDSMDLSRLKRAVGEYREDSTDGRAARFLLEIVEGK